ncbi:hypothetical protein J6590_023975, partial [Homalodisca vitripennis]
MLPFPRVKNSIQIENGRYKDGSIATIASESCPHLNHPKPFEVYRDVSRLSPYS